MKSTRVFKILSIALAAAVVFYFLVQGVRYLTNPYATTRVYTSTTEDAVEASGWLVREEETFCTDAETLSPTREEGEKVGQGQVIAATYNSPGALEAVAQIQAKRLQLEQLEYALSSYLNPDAALKLDGSISDDIMALRKNLTGGDYTAASGDLSQLKAAIVKRSRAYTSSQEIKPEITAVQDEIDSLLAGLTGASNICDHSFDLCICINLIQTCFLYIQYLTSISFYCVFLCKLLIGIIPFSCYHIISNITLNLKL